MTHPCNYYFDTTGCLVLNVSVSALPAYLLEVTDIVTYAKIYLHYAGPFVLRKIVCCFHPKKSEDIFVEEMHFLNF